MEKHLLIVEDDPHLMEVFCEIGSHNYDKIYRATNCVEIVEILRDFQVDGILSDNRLPDGRAVDVYLKHMDLVENTPIIMTSGSYEIDDVLDFLNLRNVVFMKKPIDFRDIDSKLKEQVAEIEQQRVFNDFLEKYSMQEKTKRFLVNRYGISGRELEVISSALLNSENEVIGKLLCISPGTVKRHLHNIFRKMKINSKVDLRQIVMKFNQGDSPDQST